MENQQIISKTRIAWVDALKFIGIYTIYIAHFLESAGNLYKFACMYVIQLFFFASGLFAGKQSVSMTFGEYLKKQVRHLLLPYGVFSGLNIAIIMIQENRDLKEILPLIKQMIFGIRNQLFAPALWFLPCLFVVSIFFFGLQKLFRKPLLISALSLAIYALAANLLPFDATETPKWFFNIDSACYYLFFYALGALLFPYLKNISYAAFKQLNKKRKLITGFLFICAMGIAVFVSALTFFGRKDFFVIYPLFAKIPALTWIYPIFIAGSIIFLQIFIAMWAGKIPLFCELGTHTLAFCGNETIVKTLVACILSLFGLGIQIATPLHAYVYAFILLIIGKHVMIPAEKKLFRNGMKL